MAIDAHGKHHMNPQIAKLHSKGVEAKPHVPPHREHSMHSAGNGAGQASMEIHDHGDGTFHTSKDGQETEHPDLQSVHSHIDDAFGGAGAPDKMAGAQSSELGY